jgi:hypothetical protein
MHSMIGTVFHMLIVHTWKMDFIKSLINFKGKLVSTSLVVSSSLKLSKAQWHMVTLLLKTSFHPSKMDEGTTRKVILQRVLARDENNI